MRTIQILALGLLFATAVTAHAEEDFDFEIRSSVSSMGYDQTFYGFYLGGEVSVAYRLLDNLQIVGGVGGFMSTSNSGNYHSYDLGLRYSFGSDFSRAYFIGAGAEYGNRSNKWEDEASGMGAYVEFGKRFRVNDSGSLSYTPYMTLSGKEGGVTRLRIFPISMSYSF